MFHYRAGVLFGEAVSLAAVGSLGTPVYVYSEALLTKRARAFQTAVSPPHLVCFAVKANGNVTLLRQLGKLGLGADVTSGGELYLAQTAGISPDKIIFSGVGKRADEIEMALSAGIKALHVESVMEWELIARLATQREQIVPVGVRVNPNISVETHPYISTGLAMHKFGVDPETAVWLFQQSLAHPWLKPVGIAAHIGSQIREIAPYTATVQFLVEMAEGLRELGIMLTYIDAGGGLGIDYTNESVVDVEQWLTAVAAPIEAAWFQLVVEPGRSVVAETAVLLTQVLYLKEKRDKRFVIVDAGMNDLLRPTLYQAQHRIVPVKPRAGETAVCDVVGPICESGDWLGKDVWLPPLQPGDLLAIHDVGAYGFAMSSNYNGRLRPAERLISGDQLLEIRAAQTLRELW